MTVNLLARDPNHGTVRAADIDAISSTRRAVLFDLMGGDTGASLDFNTRNWLIGAGLARPTGLGHRTLSLTSRGKWITEAIMVYEADQLMRLGVEMATGRA